MFLCAQSLSTLTLIRDALSEIKRTEGIDLDIDAIPLDDSKTYQLFADGQTYGIFQFESSGMRSHRDSSKVRMVPAISTLSGMMLKASPPRMRPTVTTADSRGCTRRDTICCRVVMMWAVASTGSIASWGMAP